MTVFRAGEPITIVSRVKSRDGDGNDVYADGATTTVTGAFEPAAGVEQTDGMDQVSTQLQVLLPTGVDVQPTDQIIARGDRYDVDGNAAAWSSPFTGWQPGVVVSLKRVTG